MQRQPERHWANAHTSSLSFLQITELSRLRFPMDAAEVWSGDKSPSFVAFDHNLVEAQELQLFPAFVVALLEAGAQA
jgi:hypothetical protein